MTPHVTKLPGFTARAAHEIRRLIATFGKDLPPDKYVNCVGWEIGFEDNFQGRPAIGLHEVDQVPESLIVECHGIRLAYNIPDDVMAALHSSVLDFDGTNFVFVSSEEASQP